MIDKLGVDEFYRKIKKTIRENNIKLQNFNEDNLYRYDNGPKKKLKILLNYKIDYEERELIRNLYLEIFNDYKSFVKFYCSVENLMEMSQNNMVIGSHTHSHKVLSGTH